MLPTTVHTSAWRHLLFIQCRQCSCEASTNPHRLLQAGDRWLHGCRVFDMNATVSGPPLTRWRWIFVIWSVVALFDATQTIGIMHSEGRQRPWLPLFACEAALWLPWALATPLVVGLARRFPLFHGARVRSVCIHLAAVAFLSAACESWSALLQVLFNPWGNRKWPNFIDTWTVSLIYQVLLFVIVYVLILTVTYIVEAREELSKAQLAALRSQMEPHFMYNALNAIAGLVRDNRSEAAVGMLVGLSEFLRRAAEDSHRSEVTLQEEVEYLQRYLDIQKVRFGERLQVSVEIPTELLHAQVPNLLLQPLVENAIKHGISKRVAGGAVRVAGEAQSGHLRLSVYNDGPTLPANWEGAQKGVGIANLRSRLRILHGADSQLQLRSAEPGGVEVVVSLPLRTALR
jgi:two-component system, LytTR family, sensor kinase